MILKQGHTYEPMPHDGKTIWCIYRGGRCYYKYSPYSLAATQALKAAFPQYWTAIRDYGYAHPQLVPFINEDPMLICSLVEVGKTRWLVAGGEPSDIVTDIPFSDYNEIEWKWMQTSNSSSLMQFGSRIGGSGSAGIIISLGKQIGNIIRIYNGNWSTIMSKTQDFIQYDMKMNLSENKIYIDGVPYNHTFTTANKEAATFKIMDGCDANISHIIADGEIIVAPFIRNNMAGWINLNDGSFYSASKGAFTIAITDKE